MFERDFALKMSIVDKLIMVCYDIADQDQKSKIGFSEC